MKTSTQGRHLSLRKNRRNATSLFEKADQRMGYLWGTMQITAKTPGAKSLFGAF